MNNGRSDGVLLHALLVEEPLAGPVAFAAGCNGHHAAEESAHG